jgi:hypothetical protein
MGTTTTNIELYKPTAGETGWDDEVNANFDTLDERVYVPHGAVQYVRSPFLGDNDNDGRSWGTAKADITSAYDALPTPEGGTIYVSSGNGDHINEISYWSAEDSFTRGLWILGPNDDAYDALPASGPDDDGFRRQKSVHIIGVPEYSNRDNTGGIEHTAFISGGKGDDPLYPAIWISGTTTPIKFSNIRSVNLANAVKIGLSVDGTSATNTSGVGFEDCMFTANSTAANADVVEGAVKVGYAFWVRFNRCTFGAANMTLDVTNVALSSGTTYTYTTSVAHGLVEGDTVDLISFTPSGYDGHYVISAVPTSTTFRVDIGSNPAAVSVLGDARPLRTDRRAGVFIGPGTGTGEPSSGLFMFSDCTFSGSAGIRYRPGGTTTFGSVVVEDCVVEGDFVNSTAPLFDLPAPSTSIPYHDSFLGGLISLRNLQVADGDPVLGTVNLDGLKDPHLVTVQACGAIVGPHTSIASGPSSRTDGDIVGSMRTRGEDRRFFGEHEGHRRAFHPSGARYVNNFNQDETTWSSGNGSATVTTGQTAPDGTTRAGKITSASTTEYRRLGVNVVDPQIGDWVVVGGWYRPETTFPSVSSFRPLSVTWSSASVKMDTMPSWASSTGVGSAYATGRDDGDWVFATAAYQVVETTTGTIALWLAMNAYAGYPFFHYGGTLLHIPASDGLTYAEVRSIRDGLASYSNRLAVGEVGTLVGQRFHAVGGMRIAGAVHASLPAASGYASGTQYYCSGHKQPIWSDGISWYEADGTVH